MASRSLRAVSGELTDHPLCGLSGGRHVSGLERALASSPVLHADSTLAGLLAEMKVWPPPVSHPTSPLDLSTASVVTSVVPNLLVCSHASDAGHVSLRLRVLPRRRATSGEGPLEPMGARRPACQGASLSHSLHKDQHSTIPLTLHLNDCTRGSVIHGADRPVLSPGGECAGGAPVQLGEGQVRRGDGAAGRGLAPHARPL